MEGRGTAAERRKRERDEAGSSAMDSECIECRDCSHPIRWRQHRQSRSASGRAFVLCHICGTANELPAANEPPAANELPEAGEASGVGLPYLEEQEAVERDEEEEQEHADDDEDDEDDYSSDESEVYGSGDDEFEFEEKGAGADIIAALPTRQLRLPPARTRRGARRAAEQARQCVICQCACDDGETLKRLPCLHEFHCECIDRWLRESAACPLCNCDARIGHLVSNASAEAQWAGMQTGLFASILLR